MLHAMATPFRGTLEPSHRGPSTLTRALFTTDRSVGRAAMLLLASCLVVTVSVHASDACDPCGACAPEDLDVSGAVDGDDLGAMLAAWGSTAPDEPADLTGDGVVDGADLGALLAAWSPGAAQPCLAITSFGPAQGGEGTTVTIAGSFPDPDPANYSVSAVAGDGRHVPFRVVSVTPSELVTTVGPFPSDMTPGFLVVTLGTGTSVAPIDLPGQFTFTGDAWVFTASDVSATSTALFTPTGVSGASGGAIQGTFFGAVDGQGGLALSMSGTCEATTRFRIWTRARHTSTGESDPAFGYDLFIPCVQLDSEQGQPACGLSLCTIIESLYGAQLPDAITVDCTVSPSDGSAIVAFYADQGSIDGGAFIIEIVSSCDGP